MANEGKASKQGRWAPSASNSGRGLLVCDSFKSCLIPMPKATLKDEVKGLQWQPWGSGLLLQLGGAAVNPQASSGSHLRSQGGLHRRLAELAGFSLVWSFVVFLGRRRPCIDGAPCINGWSNTYWPDQSQFLRQPFFYWLVKFSDWLPHCVLWANGGL